jgi:hypothetical protein
MVTFAPPLEPRAQVKSDRVTGLEISLTLKAKPVTVYRFAVSAATFATCILHIELRF